MSPQNSNIIQITFSRPMLYVALIGMGFMVLVLSAIGLSGIKSAKAHLQTLYDLDTEQSKEVDLLKSRLDEFVLNDQIKAIMKNLQFTREEVLWLTKEEQNTLPPSASLKEVLFNRELSANFKLAKSTTKVDPEDYYINVTGQEIITDSNLVKPEIRLIDVETLYPVLELGNMPIDGQAYFEFDTSPDFSSLNFWRFPSLSPINTLEDRVVKSGQSFSVFGSTHHARVDPNGQMTFPFRVTAMAFPSVEQNPSFSDMAKFAQLLGFGLSHDDQIQEIFSNISYRINWGSDTINRSPLETFSAGVGECGNLNNLAGAMMEMLGIRYRAVGGFNPRVRKNLPDAGHTLIEVLNEDGQWGVADSFLDIRSNNVSAADLKATRVGRTEVFATPTHLVGNHEFDEYVRLQDLFRYRIYHDKADRLPLTNVSQILNNEDAFGRDWALRALKEKETFSPHEDLLDRQTIYIRARYIVSDICRIEKAQSCGDINARASEWVSSSFTISPKVLLGIR